MKVRITLSEPSYSFMLIWTSFTTYFFHSHCKYHQYSYFATKNLKCRSAIHADDRQRIMDMVNSVRQRMIQSQKALMFAVFWDLQMENQAYVTLTKQTKGCRSFRKSKSDENPEEEFKKLFLKSIGHLRSSMRCSRGACRLSGRSKQYLPWLLHYRTTRLGCAGAYCGKGSQKKIMFHCLSDYGKDASGGLLFRQRGGCLSHAKCSQVIKGSKCDFEDAKYANKMCFSKPKPGDMCDEQGCRDYVRVGSTPFECKNKLHLCTNNMDYRELTTNMCAQTCGRCGIRDQALHYDCAKHTQLCLRSKKVKSDCRWSCFVKEYQALSD